MASDRRMDLSIRGGSQRITVPGHGANLERMKKRLPKLQEFLRAIGLPEGHWEPTSVERFVVICLDHEDGVCSGIKFLNTMDDPQIAHEAYEYFTPHFAHFIDLDYM